MSTMSRRLSRRPLVLAIAGLLAGAFVAEAQAPPPPVTRKKTPTPTPRAGRGGGGGGGGTSAPSAARATLLISADLDCTITIDGEAKHRIPANKPTKIEVSAGEHLLVAVSDDKRQMQQVVKAQGGGNTVVQLPLGAQARPVDPKEFDTHAARLYTSLTDLKVLGAFIDSLWRRSFFFHDRGITAAFHTAGQVLDRDLTEFQKYPAPDAARKKAFDDLVRLAPDGKKYVELITQAITAAQSANSVIGEPTNQFGQAQAILSTLSLPADTTQVLRDSADFKAELKPDVRQRIGLPPDSRDIRLGADYAQSVPQMFATIDKGGAADSMGFKPGDRVMSVDGRPATSIWDFKQALRQSGRASVVYERGGKQEKKDVKGPTS
jgi:hypothetical protein